MQSYDCPPEALPIIDAGQQEGALGVDIVALIVERSSKKAGLGSLFRKLPEHDFGLDAQMEFVTPDSKGKRHPTGRILSLQVKAGKSYFSNDDHDSWRVYVTKSTMSYWHSHTVPVILILVDTDEEQAYWVRGDGDYVPTDEHFRVQVPKANTFDASALDDLRQIAENQTEEGARLASLENSFAWIDAVHRGDRVQVEVAYQPNCAEFRKTITIGYYLTPWQSNHPEHAGLEEKHWRIDEFKAVGYEGVIESLHAVFPWAEPTQDIHEDAGLQSQFELETGFYDDGNYVKMSDETYEEWLEKQKNCEGLIIPQGVLGKETALTFTLELNQLGDAYCILRAYLHQARMG